MQEKNLKSEKNAHHIRFTVEEGLLSAQEHRIMEEMYKVYDGIRLNMICNLKQHTYNGVLSDEVKVALTHDGFHVMEVYTYDISIIKSVKHTLITW